MNYEEYLEDLFNEYQILEKIKPFTDIHEYIRNIIITGVFKYVYEKNINKNNKIITPPKLSYRLTSVKIDAGKYYLNKMNKDIILLLYKYDSNLAIYLYMINNKSYIVNLNTITNDILDIYEE